MTFFQKAIIVALKERGIHINDEIASHILFRLSQPDTEGEMVKAAKLRLAEARYYIDKNPEEYNGKGTNPTPDEVIIEAIWSAMIDTARSGEIPRPDLHLKKLGIDFSNT